MSLTAGSRLGPYEIVAPLGAGGMGEVYRARDTKLGRHVALKILPEVFASDPERLARFEREAKTLAALNHTHIAQIYGFEQSGATSALVMELVEGEDLAQRIARGAIPLDEALAIARQIANALEEAHEQGIIHRDLKPANIKLRADGTVKVLDFGLAKAAAPDIAVANSPTFTVAATQMGAIIGTAAYMPPEQARGKAVDRRADIWAFGCLLYEMLTGAQAFGSETITDTLSAILTREPDWQALPSGTPANVRRVLRLCLEKDPRRRLQHISAAQALIDLAEAPPEGARTQRTPPRLILWAVVMGLALSVAAFHVGQYIGTQQGPIGGPVAPLTRTVIDLPADAPLALGAQIPLVGFDSPVVALSPDGRHLAYVGQSPSGTMLYLRDIGRLTVRPLAGTEGAIYGFFSPDSRWLGFLTNDKVKKVSLEGGASSTLCDAMQPVNASWSRDGTIYFTEDQGLRLSRVAAAGGTATVVTVPKPDGKSTFSQILPDGNSALMSNWSRGIGADYADVVLLSLATGESKVLIRSGYDARYVPPNHLLFGRSGSLFAVRFNATRAETEGEPFLVASDASMESFFGQVHAAASENGLIAYVPGSDRATGRLAWVDRQGRTEFLPPPARLYGVIDLSPDGERLAVHVADVTDYIWIYDLRRGEGRRLTAGEHRGWPVWSHDNTTLAFSGWQASGQFRILTQQADGPGQAREIAGSVKMSIRSPSSWSPDGEVLALTEFGPTSFLTMDGTEARPAVANAMVAHFSPDGGWLAYTARDPGRAEIFAQSYADGNTVRQISVDGGGEPVWCPCGELFWRTGNRWMSVAIRTQPELSWDPPRLAFQTDFIDTPGRSYDVSPDGKRLLVVKRAGAEERSRIYLVSNWMADAEKIGLVDRNP